LGGGHARSGRTVDGLGCGGAVDDLSIIPSVDGKIPVGYRVKSVVLVEVTFRHFPNSVPDIVMTNILTNVPE
jgi:hypothetical protein